MTVYDDIQEDVISRAKDAVVNGIEQGIRNQWGAIQNPGGWVAGTEENPTAPPGTRAAARSACRRWARGAGPQGPVADMTYRPFCEQYLDDIGELPEGGEFGKNFTGGQCSGVWYEWSMTGLNGGGCAASTPYVTGGFAIGPIKGPSTRPSGNQTFPVQIGVIDGNGEFQGGTKANSAECELRAGTFSIIRRLDGQPDSCGDPVDGYKPTVYLPDDGGGREPINEPGFPPFSIDIGPDGDIVIDFPGFGGDDRTVDEPFLPPGPEDYGPDTEPPPEPGDRGFPDAPISVEPGGDAEDEKPDKVLVGVTVHLTTISPKARVSFLGGKAFYSYAYSVLMGGDGGVERDGDSSFAQADTFYHAPENSNRYSVVFRNGFGGTVVPYWKDPD